MKSETGGVDSWVELPKVLIAACQDAETKLYDLLKLTGSRKQVSKLANHDEPTCAKNITRNIKKKCDDVNF